MHGLGTILTRMWLSRGVFWLPSSSLSTAHWVSGLITTWGEGFSVHQQKDQVSKTRRHVCDSVMHYALSSMNSWKVLEHLGFQPNCNALQVIACCRVHVWNLYMYAYLTRNSGYRCLTIWELTHCCVIAQCYLLASSVTAQTNCPDFANLFVLAITAWLLWWT